MCDIGGARPWRLPEKAPSSELPTFFLPILPASGGRSEGAMAEILWQSELTVQIWSDDCRTPTSLRVMTDTTGIQRAAVGTHRESKERGACCHARAAIEDDLGAEGRDDAVGASERPQGIARAPLERYA